MWTVDIDVGGTLTDGLFTSGANLFCLKVDTTPHDLTVCLLDCLSQAAAKLNFPDVAGFLDQVELIRWSTTITSNVLAEFRGPRVGLLVSRGNERSLYGSEPRSPVLDRLLNADHILGLEDDANETAIMNAARSLLERGVRRICVSLKGAHRAPEREVSVKRVIDQQYPDHFLGSVPVLVGGEMSQSADDCTRTYCAVINAYTHGALAATLFKAEDELRETLGYRGPFLVSHINGGVAGIAKTKAIETVESGPVLGINGSAFLAGIYGLRDVIAMDVGGTTAKISALRDALPVYRKPSDLFGISLETSLPYLRSIALGGGSVVKVTRGVTQPRVELGPESMGSYPGPACYGLGGDQPTLTDVFVAAGLIDPEYFLGGTKPIDRERARDIVGGRVAGPAGISLETACRAVLDHAFGLVAAVISEARGALGNNLSNPTLFAYGGNGSLFACGVAERAGLASVLIFALGPVFSAFGSSISDICHVYERSVPDRFVSEKSLSTIREFLGDIRAEAAKDLLGEGIRPENLTFAAELEVSRDGKNSIPIACPEPTLRSVDDWKRIVASALGASESSNAKEIFPELLRVRVRKAIPKPGLAEAKAHGPDASHARIGARNVFWGASGGEAQIYRWELLQPGNRVQGCAILESANTTYFVPEGWTLTLDGYGNALLKRNSA
ncbi:MAG TPA: hydantoinase/oxoprolinase family protein [Bryobacteraceae bacterium]|nr:hydantoinase/oxoprolinase family protein [Bryobacteraceae bacterium]